MDAEEKLTAFVDREGRTIWIVDAHRDDGKRFVVRADDKLTAFLELEYGIRAALKRKETAKSLAVKLLPGYISSSRPFHSHA